jgi:hypothetical protein
MASCHLRDAVCRQRVRRKAPELRRAAAICSGRIAECPPRRDEQRHNSNSDQGRRADAGLGAIGKGIGQQIHRDERNQETAGRGLDAGGAARAYRRGRATDQQTSRREQ